MHLRFARLIPLIPLLVRFFLCAVPAGATERTFTLHGAHASDSGSVLGGVGTRVDFLPVHLIESEAPHVPSLTGQIRVGLPWSLSADLRYAGVIVKNQIEFGLGWTPTSPASRIAVSLHYHAGLRFGSLEGTGYDASSWSWVHHPGFKLTVPWKDSWFTLTTEATLGFTQYFKLGDFKDVNKVSRLFEGLQVSFLVESPVGRGFLFYGLGLSMSVPYDQAWLAFSDEEKEKSLVPQATVGYEF